VRLPLQIKCSYGSIGSRGRLSGSRAQKFFSCSRRVMPQPGANNTSQVFPYERLCVAKKQRQCEIALFTLVFNYITFRMMLGFDICCSGVGRPAHWRSVK
jgi:hypothetical protein